MIRVARCASGVAVLAAGVLVGVGPGVASASTVSTVAPGMVAAYPAAGVVCSISPNPAQRHGVVVITCSGYQVGSTVDIAVVTNGKILNPTAVPQPGATGSAGRSIAHPRASGPPAGTAPQPGVFDVQEEALDPGPVSFRVVGFNALGASVPSVVDTRVLKTSSEDLSRTCTDSSSTVSPATISAGDSTTVSGKNFDPGATVTLTDSAGDSLGSTTATSSGTYSTTITVSRTGSLTVYAAGADTASGTCGKQSSSARLTVLAQSGAGLPFTGADGIGTMIILGAGLLAAGTGVLAAQRRRRLITTSRTPS